MRRRAVSLVAVAGALVTAGCHISHVKPGDTVVITGRAITATGAPFTHATVRLFKEADFGEAVLGAVFTIGTLGGICFLPGAPDVCNKGHRTATDAAGNYSFTLHGSDTQGLVGDASTLGLAIGDSATGASTTVSFRVDSTTVTLPAARLWAGPVRVSRPHGRIAITATPPPAAYGSSRSYSAQLAYPTHLPLWSQQASATGHAVIDARLTEDGPALAYLSVRTSVGHGVHATYVSPHVTVAPSAGAPPSRHVPCSALSGTAQRVSTPQSSCAVTDGNLTAPAHLTAATTVTGAVIDLGRARRLSYVVARNTAGYVVIEISADGRNYTQVGTGSGVTVVATPAGRPVARFVRVRSATGLDESLMSELSAW